MLKCESSNMLNKSYFLTDKAVKLMSFVVFLSQQTECVGKADACLTLLEPCVPSVLFPCAPVSCQSDLTIL